MANTSSDQCLLGVTALAHYLPPGGPGPPQTGPARCSAPGRDPSTASRTTRPCVDQPMRSTPSHPLLRCCAGSGFHAELRAGESSPTIRGRPFTQASPCRTQCGSLSPDLAVAAAGVHRPTSATAWRTIVLHVDQRLGIQHLVAAARHAHGGAGPGRARRTPPTPFGARPICIAEGSQDRGSTTGRPGGRSRSSPRTRRSLELLPCLGATGVQASGIETINHPDAPPACWVVA